MNAAVTLKFEHIWPRRRVLFIPMTLQFTRLSASVFPIMLQVFRLRNKQILSHYYSDDAREQTLGSAAPEARDVRQRQTHPCGHPFCWEGRVPLQTTSTPGDPTTASNFKYTLIQPIFHTA